MKRMSFISRRWRFGVPAALMAGAISISPAAYAMPTGGNSSTAAIAVSGKTMNITGATNNLITWVDFSIGKGEQVAFDANNYLNYVTGGKASSLLGSLTGKGSICLVNPSGITIGDGASINVGSLHLSTADLSGSLKDYTTALNALNQATNFVGDVVNKGNLTAAKEITVQGNNVTFKNVADVQAGTSLKVKAADSEAFHSGRTNNSTLTLTGDSTAPTYYKLISDAAGLRNIDSDLAGNYMLANDINLTAPADRDTGSNFAPIGGTHWNAEAERFTGRFDGLNYSINNLYQYNDTTDNYVSGGLFAGIGEGGVVENLILGTGKSTLILSQNGYNGSFAGINYGTLRNVVNKGVAVAGSNYSSGGITGFNINLIDGATNNAAVTTQINHGSGGLGGIAGSNRGSISNSLNTGTVITSSSNVGGIVGYDDNQGKISNVANTGAVTGKSNVGGIAGYSDGTITNAYNTGNITSTLNTDGNASVGGIVGHTAGNVANAFNSGNVTGPTDGADSPRGGTGGIAGTLGTDLQARGKITNAYNTGTVHGKDYVGGIIGNNWTASGGYVAIENVYNTGEISSTLLNHGAGIDGSWHFAERGKSQNAFFSNGAANGGGTQVTDAAMKKAATFTGFDMDTDGTRPNAVWRIYEGKTTPLLTAFMTPLRLADTTLIYDGQSHSVANLANVDTGKIYGGSLPFYTNIGTYKYTGLQSLYSDQFGYNIIAPGDTATLTIKESPAVAAPQQSGAEAQHSGAEAQLADITEQLEKIGADLAQLEAAVSVASAPASSEPLTDSLDTAATTATTSGDKNEGKETGTAVPAAAPGEVTWTGQGVLTVRNGGVKEPESMQGEDVAKQQQENKQEKSTQEESEQESR